MKIPSCGFQSFSGEVKYIRILTGNRHSEGVKVRHFPDASENRLQYTIHNTDTKPPTVSRRNIFIFVDIQDCRGLIRQVRVHLVLK